MGSAVLCLLMNGSDMCPALLILSVLNSVQAMFEPYLKSFFVHSNDPTNIKLLKVSETLYLSSGLAVGRQV